LLLLLVASSTVIINNEKAIVKATGYTRHYIGIITIAIA